MKIDERALKAARHAYDNEGKGLVECIETYLAALPSAAPGRDRIAAVIDETGYVVASSATYAFRALQERLEAGGSKGPFEHFYISGNWPRPKPAEPVEVSGTVEGVTP